MALMVLKTVGLHTKEQLALTVAHEDSVAHPAFMICCCRLLWMMGGVKSVSVCLFRYKIVMRVWMQLSMTLPAPSGRILYFFFDPDRFILSGGFAPAGSGCA